MEENDYIKQHIMDIQLKNNMQLFNEACQKFDYENAILYLEHAVKCGYQGDYSLIGTSLFFGRHNVPKDSERGIEWITRFVCDMEQGVIGNIETSNVFLCYLALGSNNLYRVDSNEYSENEKKAYVEKGIGLWKYAASQLEEDTVPDCIQLEVYDLAVAFFKGYVKTYNGTQIVFDKDYKLSNILFTKLFRKYEAFFAAHGINWQDYYFEHLKRAGRYLAQIYDQGLGTDKDEQKATEYYKELALSEDEVDVKNLLMRFRNMIHVPDVLPWKQDEKVKIKFKYNNLLVSFRIAPYGFIRWLETSDTLRYEEFKVGCYKEEIDLLEAVVKKLSQIVKEKLHADRVCEQLISIGNKNNGFITYSSAEDMLSELNNSELNEVINNIAKAGLIIVE